MVSVQSYLFSLYKYILINFFNVLLKFSIEPFDCGLCAKLNICLILLSYNIDLNLLSINSNPLSDLILDIWPFESLINFLKPLYASFLLDNG